jgi:hypothetical protein
LYGDHPSSVAYGTFKKSPAGEKQVPCFIHKVGFDIAGKQVTRDKPVARSGELNLLDVVNFIRACILR